MKNLIALTITGLLVAVAPAIAKDKHKGTSLEDAIVKEIFDDNDKHNGKHDDPGAHGRANAAEKQSSHGKGSKKADEDLEDVISRELFEDDDHDDKHKKKKKK